MTVKIVLYKDMLKVVAPFEEGVAYLEYIPNSDSQHLVRLNPHYTLPFIEYEYDDDYDGEEICISILHAAPNKWLRYNFTDDLEEMFGSDVEYGFDGLLYEGE